MNNSLAKKEHIEIDFWRTAPSERPEADSLDNLVNKFSEAKVLLEKLEFFRGEFEKAGTILELGGGQGWASCFIKRLFPSATVYASDISEYAVASAHKWEYLLKTRLDRTFSCRSYEIPLPDASVDLVWCFQAAHHFVAHRKTLVEVARILKPGGVCLYLHEPSCRSYIHGLAHWRVNRKRPEVPEDVLVHGELEMLARRAGLATQLRYDPTPANRGPVETVYYMVLQRSGLLRNLLPCTMDYTFRKSAG